MAPNYLCEPVSIRKYPQKLRSSNKILLRVPVTRLKSYGDCVFIVTALWNRLPADIRNASSLEQYKHILKTHLFKVAFTGKNFDYRSNPSVAFTDIIIWGITVYGL